VGDRPVCRTGRPPRGPCNTKTDIRRQERKEAQRGGAATKTGRRLAVGFARPHVQSRLQVGAPTAAKDLRRVRRLRPIVPQEGERYAARNIHPSGEASEPASLPILRLFEFLAAIPNAKCRIKTRRHGFPFHPRNLSNPWLNLLAKTSDSHTLQCKKASVTTPGIFTRQVQRRNLLPSPSCVSLSFLRPFQTPYAGSIP